MAARLEDGEEKVLQDFEELQQTILNQADASNRIQQQERICSIQRQKTTLTKTELAAMPDQTVMYRSVGRAYFCSPKAEMVQDLEGRLAALDAEAAKIKAARDAVDAKLKDTDNQLRELISQSPSLVRRLGAVNIGK
ncbi:hypothetical protein HYH03_012772 [Edaphochlamys debaryana]|uniref:Prefoldin subunit 1 n=1 Tax=Edaphochlamys debaryana TaxID=47281 RepID=A0A835XSB4_9CHLO|nr:hypothetical protein HYH03_012772 [Edaphochlamys debaryana]|eukprot:KAG2488775.1 hypothetical protein HYH03_012772 [Edaphochlamys debaryana]